MTIYARFDGKCRHCGGAIAKGDRVDWQKGAGVAHAGQCPLNPTPPAPRQNGGKLKDASDKQKGWLTRLLERKDLTFSTVWMDSTQAMDEEELIAYHASLVASVATMNWKQASGWIEALMPLPWVDDTGNLMPWHDQAGGHSAPNAPRLPSGRYAVQDDEGEWKLYRVWNGSRGTDPPCFLYAVKGTEKGDRVTGAEEAWAKAEIAKDPGEAAIAFGHLTGSCSRCGKELDVNLSRHLGIGPDCIKHWFEREARLTRVRHSRSCLRAAGLDPKESNDNLAGVAR